MFDTKADYASQSAIPGLHDDEIESRVLSRILLRQAERHGSRTFIDVCGRATSFEDMLDVSWRLANGLRWLGVSRSDRVAMLLPNCFELVATWFALSNLGAIEVPTNPGLKGDLLCHNLNNCGAEVLVADAGALTELARVQEHLPDVRTLVLVGADPGDARAAGVKIGRIVRFEECLATPSAPDLATIHYSDPMAILYTSGTTGPAKGALMSHHHCYSWAAAMAANLGYTTQDSYFSALPLFHTDAQMFGVYLPLIYGTRATLVEGFSASRFWEQVRGSGATATNLLGAMAVILMRAPPGKDDRGNPVRVCQCIPMVPDKEAFECRFGMRLVTGARRRPVSWLSTRSMPRGPAHAESPIRTGRWPWSTAGTGPCRPALSARSSRARGRAGACFPATTVPTQRPYRRSETSGITPGMQASWTRMAGSISSTG